MSLFHLLVKFFHCAVLCHWNRIELYPSVPCLLNFPNHLTMLKSFYLIYFWTVWAEICFLLFLFGLLPSFANLCQTYTFIFLALYSIDNLFWKRGKCAGVTHSLILGGAVISQIPEGVRALFIVSVHLQLVTLSLHFNIFIRFHFSSGFSMLWLVVVFIFTSELFLGNTQWTILPFSNFFA